MAKPLSKTLIEVDLAAVTGSLKTEETMKAYTPTLKELCRFVTDVDWKVGTKMIGLTDDSIAKFMGLTNTEKGNSPSLRKTTLAAINYQLQVNEQENIYTFKHLYPKTQMVLDAQSP